MGAQSKLRYRQSESGAETIRKWDASAPGRASKKRRNANSYKRLMADPATRLWERIRIKLHKMLKKQVCSSSTVSKWSNFMDSDSVILHFGFMLSGEMTMQNYGTKWHIGHRIARSMYDAQNPVDIKRCWNAQNLFPQLADENLQCGVNLPSDLALLESIWPTSWSSLPDQSQRKILEAQARGHA